MKRLICYGLTIFLLLGNHVVNTDLITYVGSQTIKDTIYHTICFNAGDFRDCIQHKESKDNATFINTLLSLT